MKTERFWSEQELAEWLGVHRRTLENERNRGRLNFFRVGGQIRYSQGQVDAYLTLCKERAGSVEVHRRRGAR